MMISSQTCFRRGIVWFIEWAWFDRFIILLIFLNSIFMALYDYSDRENLTQRNQLVELTGFIFSGLFTVECLLKVLGMGFICHKNAYLRDTWNWIDFVVVIIGQVNQSNLNRIIEIIPGIPNMKALRTLRVLRPLRSIKSIPSMRKLIGSLIASLPALANVVVFLMFVFILFGILGVQQYVGAFYNRCRMTPQPVDGKWEIDPEITRICTKDGSGLFKCPSERYCGHPSEYPEILNLQTEGVINQEEIFYGIVTFDNIGIGMITIFQIVTLEGWTEMMYDLMDNSQTEFSAIFFCLMVLFGSFFLLQLILAVIMGTFYEMENRELLEKIAEHDQNNKHQEEKKGQNEQPPPQVPEQEDPIKIRDSQIDHQDSSRSIQQVDVQEQTKVDDVHQAPQSKSKSNRGQVDSIEQDINDLKLLDNSENADKQIAAFRSKSVTSAKEFKSNSMKNLFQDMIEEIPEPGDEQDSLVQNTDQAPLDDIGQRASKSKFLWFFYRLCTHSMFTLFVVMLILGNTVTLALDKYPIDPDEYSRLELANQIFSWFFFAEMVIKLIGLGLVGYSRDRFNIFDCLIVIISTVELVIGWTTDGGGAGGAISAFRGVRLLRVFKLARSWKSFQEILRKILNSLKDISNFSVLLFLFIFIYALLGMELFAYRIKFNENNEVDLNGESTRTNFDEFINSVTTIFVVLIGEDWNNIMYQYVRATETRLCIAFFVSWMILGNLVLLNLFLAILLKNFSEEVDLDDDNEQPEIKLGFFKKIMKKVRKILRLKKKKSRNDSSMAIEIESSYEQKPRDGAETNEANVNNIEEDSPQNSHKENERSDRKMLEEGQEYDPKESLKPDQAQSKKFSEAMKEKRNSFNDSGSKNSALSRTLRQRSGLLLVSAKTARQSTMIDMKLEGRALFIFGPSNSFRKLLHKVISYRYFDSFILFMIIASTFLLTLENPLDDPNGNLAKNLYYIDIGVTSIFTIEMLMKIFVMGFMFCGSPSYMRNAWNILDFFIVTFSIISLSPIDVELKFLKVLRILRVLRPLRMISRNEGLKVAVLSLINAGPGIINVLVISVLFFLLFGILGVTYFKGEFFSCHMDNVPNSLQASVNTGFKCVDLGGEWINADGSFDNILEAMITLFEMSSTEGWIDVMWSGVDSVDIMYQPVQNYGFAWVFFFIGFIIIGSLFVLNLFVGVVIDTFNREKEKLGKDFILTDNQREWIQIQLLCFKSKPLQKVKLTGNACRDFNIKIATHKYFDGFIIFCIILNTVVLALKFYDEPAELPQILEIVNYVFAGIFTLEAIIKLIALGGNYFRDGWNVFDFIIVIGTFAGIILTQTTNVSVGPQTTLIRAFRIGRIFRLIKKAKQLRMIFNTFVITIPSLANVGSLLVLLLYIYSVLGVFLFATIKLQDTLDDHANFQNFGNAFLTLIRASTGEAWNAIMNDCSRAQTVIFDCIVDPSYAQIQANGGTPNGCGTDFALFYFVSFLVIVTFVFLNLFIAIILEGFDQVNQFEDLRIPESLINDFKEHWAEYDHNVSLSSNLFQGNGFIHVNDLNPLIGDLVDSNCEIIKYRQSLKTVDRRNKFIHQLRVPCYKNFTQYHYLDVLHALCKQNFSISFLKYKRDMVKIKDNLKQKDKEEVGADDFDQVQVLLEIIILISIEQIENKFAQNKISAVESFRKVAFSHHKKTKKSLSQFEGTIFDSSHIIMAPMIQKYARQFLKFIKDKKNTEQPPQSNSHQNSVISDQGTSRLQKQKSMLKKGMSTDVDTAIGSNEDNRIKEHTPDVSGRLLNNQMNQIQEEQESVYSRQGSMEVDRQLSKFGKNFLNNQNYDFQNFEEKKDDVYLKAPFSPTIQEKGKREPQSVSKSHQLPMPYSSINENEENDVNRIESLQENSSSKKQQKVQASTKVDNDEGERESQGGDIEIDSPSLDNMLLEMEEKRPIIQVGQDFYNQADSSKRQSLGNSMQSDQASIIQKGKQ